MNSESISKGTVAVGDDVYEITEYTGPDLLIELDEKIYRSGNEAVILGIIVRNVTYSRPLQE